MTRYVLRINDAERVDNGDESDFDDVKYEVGELLRSGYFEIEKFVQVPEYPECGND